MFCCSSGVERCAQNVAKTHLAHTQEIIRDAKMDNVDSLQAECETKKRTRHQSKLTEQPAPTQRTRAVLVRLIAMFPHLLRTKCLDTLPWSGPLHAHQESMEQVCWVAWLVIHGWFAGWASCDGICTTQFFARRFGHGQSCAQFAKPGSNPCKNFVSL